MSRAGGNDPLLESKHVLNHMQATFDAGLPVNAADSQRRCANILRAAGHTGSLQLCHATAVMELLRTSLFEVPARRELIVIANSVSRETLATGATGRGGGQRGPQSMECFHLYADAAVWDAFCNADVSWEEALNCVKNRCLSLGLVNPTEPKA